MSNSGIIQYLSSIHHVQVRTRGIFDNSRRTSAPPLPTVGVTLCYASRINIISTVLFLLELSAVVAQPPSEEQTMFSLAAKGKMNITVP